MSATGSNSVIIGFGHYSRTGKTTIAEMLQKELTRRNIHTIIWPLAEELKAIAFRLYQWAGLHCGVYYEITDRAKERYEKLRGLPYTPVELWVKLGNAIRSVDEASWVNYIFQEFNDSHDVLIIPDVRFPSEVKAIRERGGLLFKVTRPGVEPLDTESDKALLDYDGWDGEIRNNGPLSALDVPVKVLVKTVIEGLDAKRNGG